MLFSWWSRLSGARTRRERSRAKMEQVEIRLGATRVWRVPKTPGEVARDNQVPELMQERPQQTAPAAARMSQLAAADRVASIQVVQAARLYGQTGQCRTLRWMVQITRLASRTRRAMTRRRSAS